eukprot:GHRQ01011322.1.p1 GENE.GHRQ01011322.1~~GHRQ01011322.1.p1  ORF type:complete len:124 (+),score=26.24 GHRQ01011322.1:141-512(+)
MHLIDFYNFKPPAELLVNRDESQAIRVNAAKTSLEFRRNAFNTDSVDEALDLLDFCYKIVSRSGLSENGTYLPKAIHPKYSCVTVSILTAATAAVRSRCCQNSSSHRRWPRTAGVQQHHAWTC